MEWDDGDEEAEGVTEPKQIIPRVGYNKLQDWMQLNPDDLLTYITIERSGFPHALEDVPMMKKPDCMGGLLAVIARALMSTANPRAVILLLNKIRSSRFLEHGLADYLTAMQMVNSAARYRSFRQPIKDMLALMKHLMTSFPGNIQQLLPTIIVADYTIRALRQSTTVVDAEIERSLEEVNNAREDLMNREKARKAAASVDGGQDDGEASQAHEDHQPPNDFREMTIFPDVQQDILARAKPFLRPNKTRGGYDDTGHYLDVQFRLLREDFIQPLRKGIREYLDLQRADGRNVRLSDIRVYHDVSVLVPVCTHSGIQYRIRFDVSRMKHINWRYSKRLIFGSLLCLSKDEFNTIFIATVSDRKPELLQDGYLQVRFEVDPDAVRRIQPDERFVMVETSAYFEAYRHVLTALQTMDDDDIPFRNNIIACNPQVNPPRYLFTAAEPTYNIQPLIDEGHRQGQGRAQRLDDSDDDSDEDYAVAPYSVLPILQPDRWPSAETLRLDDSQLRAIRAALTRELTIIQGPPGTGKTYIGLKIVEALHVNRGVWNPNNNRNDNSPILVVCYTNHALDQFLEGIHGFMKTGIVRVGGRSKNEKMKGFLLSELRRKVRDMRTVPRHIFQARMDMRHEMEKWQVEIETTAALIDGTERGLLHEEVLQDFMAPEHYESLTQRVHPPEEETDHGIFSNSNRTSRYGPSCLPLWLGLNNMLYREENPPGGGEAEVNPEDPEAPAAAEAGAAPGEDAANRIEIEDEVAAIEDDRRIAELEDDEAVLRRHQEEMRQVRIRDQANQRLVFDIDNIPDGGGGGGEWQVQRGGKKRRRQRLQRELRSTDTAREEEVDRIGNVWTLDEKERWRLYRYWIGLYRNDLKDNVLECELQFQIAADRLKEILEQEDRAIMQAMTVIGMTTTGAARYKNALRQIRPKIVIVEEAAEVLEAQVITTLSAGCEHLVLIGDHKQLRPSANVYRLAEDYGLKYSLFERLVNNDIPHETLRNQHRMRPEIADLVRIIYDDLNDHATVAQYDDIRGVGTNLFLVNHDEEELKDEELKSVSNIHEASFVVALCRYLTLQGYRPSQITILTPYTGQMFLFKRLMPKEQFDGVRVCPVDNYQGEENDIVLLSLVRSNTQGKIGFVKDDNRACVAMSRAKKGFYLIGNFDHLARHSNLWSKITQKARQMGKFGNSLRLCCQNHPDEARIEVRSARDFEQAPEGGCLRPCGFRLTCGHACERVCHSYDREHDNYRCQKPCGKTLCANGHRCKKRCQEPCGDCKQLVDRVMPGCGHRQRVPCSVPLMDFKCQADCNHLLRCRHLCRNKCGEEHTRRCMVLVQKALGCGHSAFVRCHEGSTEDVRCGERCAERLDCGHPCPGDCGSCFQGRLHAPCRSQCGRTVVCGHQCTEPCTRNCPPCAKKCENRCVHSRCPRECGRTCEPCREPCQWRCEHFACTMLCHEPCDRVRCDRPCRRVVPGCGHPCIGLCGERCPDKCRVCHRDEVTDLFFGTEDEDDARFVQLEDCGHIFEVSGLDRWMDMAADRRSAVDIQMKQCPKCKTAIRRNLRYGTIINSILSDIERVKGRIFGDRTTNARKRKDLLAKLRALSSSLTDEQDKYFKDRLGCQDLTADEVACLENALNFAARIVEWKAQLDADVRVSGDDDVNRKLQALKAEAGPLLSWFLRQRTRFSEQELREARWEFSRFVLLAKCVPVEGKLNSCQNPRMTVAVRRRFETALGRLRSGQPLTEPLEAEAKLAANEVVKLIGGLGISEEERQKIVTAMGMSQGHWFKCPQGHIYAIGECGGAMEESDCPECGSRVGGTNHRLLETNALASEMDGATAPAYNVRNLPDPGLIRRLQFE